MRTSLLKDQRHWTHLYVGTCKGDMIDQDIPPKKSEALNSPLCWNMQRSFDYSEHPPEKSEALDSPPMLEHAKAI